MLGVAAVALFLSTLTTSSIGAALGTIGVLITSTVLLGLDAAESLHPVPADPLLAGLRRPLPGPDPVGRRDARSGGAARLPAGLRARRLGELQHQGHQRLILTLQLRLALRRLSADCWQSDPDRHPRTGRRPSTEVTAARLTGSPGSSPCSAVEPGQTSWTSTLSAPSSAAESTGVTTRSKRDRTVAQSGPSGVSSPALSRRSRSLSGTSCSQAVGQPPASSLPERRLAGAVVRRAEGEHPPGRAPLRRGPEPRAGRPRRPRSSRSRPPTARRTRPEPLAPPRPGARPRPAGRRCRRRAAPPRPPSARPRAARPPAGRGTRPGRRTRAPAAPGPAGPAARRPPAASCRG